MNGQSATARFDASRRATRDRNEFYGICRGVIFDGNVSQLEAENLLTWMQMNTGLIESWPGNVIYEQLKIELSGGNLSKEGSAALLTLMKEATGQAQKAEGVDVTTGEVLSVAVSTALPTVHVDSIVFEESVFVLTGQFEYGTRTECEDAISDLGGRCVRSPTKKTHYLVIGELGSNDWSSTSAGRKIEKAVGMREAGHHIKIISEQNWSKFLDG
ncbi:NAD-dependent DNA ligase [Neptunomonas japonica JAMM 1380]|uniref:NAD-dependent DNA ligase n=1 Tax=Neptunomonas japonica JAMM 1380 TaxID=1441457 RepID=A0A7R6PBD4_9GAMM|nr:NAD-dependent DNA ligase [Neptunomonas japonica JAMM 1380]